MNEEKEYRYEILTGILRPEEYQSFIGDLQQFFAPDETVHLSFAWDSVLADDKQLPERDIKASLLSSTLLDIIAKTKFSFGSGDIWISTLRLEFQFCNDRDLHFRSDDKSVVRAMIAIW